MPPKPLDQARSVPAWIRRHRNVLTGLFLLLAAWGLYAPSIGYNFVYFDDVRILRDHPEIYGQAHLSDDFKAIFVNAFPREEPLLLRDVSWAIDSRLFGFGNPFGYHLVNVLLHGAVVALLFTFLLTTTRRYSISLASTLTWMFLAVHTEPVAWIMGRKDILSTLFMLLALCAQTRRLAASQPGQRSFWYVATVLSVFCGLLSKVSVLTFPLVLFLHAVLLPYLRREPGSDSALPPFRALVREGLLAFPSLVLSLAVYVWYSRILTQVGLLDRGYTAHGLGHLWNLLMINPLVLWFYLKQICLPSGLSVIYKWPTLQPAYPGWQVAVGLATLALALSAGIWLFRKRRDLFFYYAAFFILMVPYFNLTYIGIWVADRYLYFAALFPLLIGVTLAAEALQRQDTPVRRAVVTIIAAIFCLGNISRAVSYQPAWSDAESLWKYHLALANPAPEAFGNLAAYYYSVAFAHQNTLEADKALQKMAVVVDAGLDQFWPRRRGPAPAITWQLFFLRSMEQEVNGQLSDALASLRLSDQLRPGFDSINLNMARLCFHLCQTDLPSQKKVEFSREASHRFAEYIKLAYRGRTPSTEIRQEQSAIEENYAVLARQNFNAQP